jgi:hypothetical protein
MPRSLSTDRSQFLRTAQDVESFMAQEGRVPSAIWVGSVPVTPESWLVACASIGARHLFAGRRPPARVALRPARLKSADHVAEDSPRLWGWIIFRKGFSAIKMMALAKRQAWTLKPAILQ